MVYMPKSEVIELRTAVKQFAEKMEERLLEKLKEGYTGWDDPEKITNVELISRMHDDINSADPATKSIDISNRAMMLWWRKERGR